MDECCRPGESSRMWHTVGRSHSHAEKSKHKRNRMKIKHAGRRRNCVVDCRRSFAPRFTLIYRLEAAQIAASWMRAVHTYGTQPAPDACMYVETCVRLLYRLGGRHRDAAPRATLSPSAIHGRTRHVVLHHRRVSGADGCQGAAVWAMFRKSAARTQLSTDFPSVAMDKLCLERSCLQFYHTWEKVQGIFLGPHQFTIFKVKLIHDIKPLSSIKYFNSKIFY